MITLNGGQKEDSFKTELTRAANSANYKGLSVGFLLNLQPAQHGNHYSFRFGMVWYVKVIFHSLNYRNGLTGQPNPDVLNVDEFKDPTKKNLLFSGCGNSLWFNVESLDLMGSKKALISNSRGYADRTLEYAIKFNFIIRDYTLNTTGILS